MTTWEQLSGTFGTLEAARGQERQRIKELLVSDAAYAIYERHISESSTPDDLMSDLIELIISEPKNA